MSENIAIPGLILLLLGVLIWIAVASFNQVETQCKERYGEEWVGQSYVYSPNVCVNKNGDVKYLQ